MSMFSLSSKVTIFRVSLCMLLIGMEFLACLVGKLIKERSLVLYNYFYSLCIGMLLANGLSWFLFGGIVSKVEDSRFSFAIFSLSFILLLAYSITSKASSYEYEKLMTTELEEIDEEDLGIELSGRNHTIRSSSYDIDLASRRRQQVAAAPEATSTDDAHVWQGINLAGLVALEVTKGILAGNEEHADSNFFWNLFLVGIVQSMIFGAICEESISNPTTFIRSILALIFSLPFGMLVGVVFTFSKSLDSYGEIVNCFVSGLYCATAVSYMMPVSHVLSSTLFNSINSNERSTIIRWKAVFLILGYCLASITAVV